MDSAISAYLDDSFKKIQNLKSNAKGEVWLATDVAGRLVIIKRIFLTGLPYQKLKKETPAICPRVYQCIETSTETVVVEEYIQGETLADRLREKRPLSEKEIKNLLIQLCEGIAPIHKMGIIHRDIKPSNLMIQADGVLRLIDFDAARTVKKNESEDTNLLGTKGYAPPEQFGYGQTNERSDIYAIGVTFKKLLGDNYKGYLTKILEKCVEIDPKKRYASVKELKNTLIFHDKKIFFKMPPRLLLIIKMTACLLLIIAVTVIFIFFRQQPQDNTDDADGYSPPVSITQESSEVPTSEPTTGDLENHLPAVSIVQESPKVSMPEPTTDSKNAQDMPQASSKKLVESTPVAPQISTEPIAPPASSVPSAPPATSVPSAPTGYIDAALYLNGVEYLESQGAVKIKKRDWHNQRIKLRITNYSNIVWENPRLKIVIYENWGQKKTTEATLPPIAPQKNVDFSVPVKNFIPTDTTNALTDYTAIWVQIYLNEPKAHLNGHYHCVMFELL